MAHADATALLSEQLDEIEALQSCYPDELEVDESTMRFAKLVATGQSAVATAADVPALSGNLRLPGLELAGQPMQLAFVMPKQSGVPGLRVQSNASRQDADMLQRVVNEAAAGCIADGMPCLLTVVGALTEAASRLAEAQSAAAAADRQHAGEQPPAATEAAAAGGSRGGGRQLVLSRRCIWYHHIKNLAKRKSIVDWGSELGLGGYSKPGFPGVVLVEGAGCDIDEYLSRLRRLRWQAMAVRGEEDVPVGSQQELDSLRRLPRKVLELGEEDMGRLAAASREAGLEELFLTALKLSPSAAAATR